MNRILLLRALSAFHVQKFDDAVRDLVALSERVPHDHMVTFVLDGILKQIPDSSNSDRPLYRNAYQAVAESTARRQATVKSAANTYAGFTIPFVKSGTTNATATITSSCDRPLHSDWTPPKLHHIPTKEEFLEYKQRRQPFILSLKDNATLSQPQNCPATLLALNWPNVCRWDSDYFCDQLPNEKVRYLEID